MRHLVQREIANHLPGSRILENVIPSSVLCITGNGLKTTDAIAAEFPVTEVIAPRLDAFEAYLETQLPATAAARA